MLYHRYTNSNTPMSSWGHAMFVDNNQSSDHYGDNHYTFASDVNTVTIASLEGLITTTWTKCQEDEDFGDLIDEYYQSLSASEVFDGFNPSDIVNSAAGWDCELMVWFWQFIAEPNGIMSIITEDGAIVFDADLINKEDNQDD